MGGEEIKEFVSALFSGFGSILDIWVSGGIKLELDFINLESAIAILIQLVECLLHQVGSVVREGSQNCIHKLLEVNCAVSVLIEDTKYLLSFFLGTTNLIIFKGFLELLEVQCTRLIRVHDLELSL